MNEPLSEELLSAYLDGELPADERARVEQWLAESPQHRRLVDDLQTLRRELQSLPQQTLDANFSERVLAAIRQRTEAVAEPQTKTEDRPVSKHVAAAMGMPAWRWFAAGVAATLATGLVLVSVLPPAYRAVGFRSDDAQSSPPTSESATPAPQAKQDTFASAPQDSAPRDSAMPEATPAPLAPEPGNAEQAGASAPPADFAPRGPRGVDRLESSSDLAAPPASAGAAPAPAEMRSFKQSQVESLAEAIKQDEVTPVAPALVRKNEARSGGEERLTRLLAQANEEGLEQVVEVQVAVADVNAGKALVAQVLDQRQRRLAGAKARADGVKLEDEFREADRAVRLANKKLEEQPAALGKAVTDFQDDVQVTAMEVVASVDELQAVLAALDNKQLQTQVVETNLVTDPAPNAYYYQRSREDGEKKLYAKDSAGGLPALDAAKPADAPIQAEAEEKMSKRKEAKSAPSPTPAPYGAATSEEAERFDRPQRQEERLRRDASRGAGGAAGSAGRYAPSRRLTEKKQDKESGDEAATQSLSQSGDAKQEATKFVRVRLVFIPQQQAAEPVAEPTAK